MRPDPVEGLSLIHIWWIVEDLTTEIGPRQAATEAEAAARLWAVKRLKEMGFQNVRQKGFKMPAWVRGEEQASLIGPFHPQKIAIAALGNSASTGPKGIEGDIVYFGSFDALQAAPDQAVKGKIVFIDHKMQPVSYTHLDVYKRQLELKRIMVQAHSLVPVAHLVKNASQC